MAVAVIRSFRCLAKALLSLISSRDGEQGEEYLMAPSIQSQSASLPVSHASSVPPYSQQPDTFGSASTASLPLRYRIILALPPRDFPPALDDVHAHHVRGEEFLSDGWRRTEELEGSLETRRQAMKAKREEIRPLGLRQASSKDESGSVTDEKQPMWFTASMHIPCLCAFFHSEY